MSRFDFADGSALVVKGGHLLDKSEDAQGRMLCVVSSATEDSDRDIIHVDRSEKGDGWLLARFNSSPAMLWSHGYTRTFEDIPLGGGEAFTGNHPALSRALFFRPEFDTEDPNAMLIHGKVKRGFVTDLSIGALISRGKYEKRPEGGLEIHEIELQEISWCTRGANPDARVVVRSMMDRSPEFAARLVEENGGAAAAAEAKNLLDIKAELALLREERAAIKTAVAEASHRECLHRLMRALERMA